MQNMTGGQIVVQTLRELGVQNIFSVSGNQILSIYDAAGERGLRIIHLRHESAAAYAAASAAEIGNQPGVLLVSAGPAFMAALAGVAAAKSMELPLLFLSGASATSERGAGGFQDCDQQGVAQIICKASWEISTIEQIQAVLSQAWELSQADIPGPVHVSLPANVLRAIATEPGSIPLPPQTDPSLSPAEESVLQTIAQRIVQARRPLIIVRPSAARGEAGKVLWRIAHRLHIKPVVAECPRGLRDLKYGQAVRLYPESDVALVVGPADFTVGFLSPSAIAARGQLFLIDAPGDPQPHRSPDAHLQIAPTLALHYLQEHISETVAVGEEWAHLWAQTLPVEVPSESMGIHPLEVAAHVRGLLQPEDVLVLDGGEFCQWVRLGLRNVPNRMLWNSRFGGIGGSIPMALGVAATGHAGRTIVLMGDGAAGYHFSEFETAARYGLSFVAIIGNDARWSAEWFQQVNSYGPERTFETALSPARYDQAAIGFGASGSQVSDTPALGRALAAGLSAQGPVCLNVQVLSRSSPAVEA